MAEEIRSTQVGAQVAVTDVADQRVTQFGAQVAMLDDNIQIRVTQFGAQVAMTNELIPLENRRRVLILNY